MTDPVYLLDTAPLTALLLSRLPAVTLIGPWVLKQEATTSILVYGEVVEYLDGREDAIRRRRTLRELLEDVTPLSLNMAILDRYADLRRRMRRPHGRGLIGDVDTLIAATAVEHGLTIVTTDGDFRRVPGLRVILLAPRTYAPVPPAT